jgi:hypothetical protein
MGMAPAWLAPLVWTLGLALSIVGICYVGFTVAFNVDFMGIGTPKSASPI